ncbi:hypothetical protein BCR44DRAFT_34536 [Catenaria anguillulae PL171]|uniref:GDP/GTP exchange factor Sec2 N-terminal domain-containing protein n=1 Tax=Catenaria anguillulae PL171 TaxID=765915 RepID=A0A1Y2I6W3_9FUNG|nr:hypothetical protein BCR44DRAFT_34536 [Catenaria anguillulae PL171]
MAPPPANIPVRVASSSASAVCHPGPTPTPSAHAAFPNLNAPTAAKATPTAADTRRSDRGRERAVAAGPMPTPPHSAGLVAPPQFSRSQSPTRTAVFSPAMLGSRLRPVVTVPADASPGQSHADDSNPHLPSPASSPSSDEVMPPLPRALPPSPAVSSAPPPLVPASIPNGPPPPSRIPSVPVPVSVAPVNIATLPADPATSLSKPSSPASPTSPLKVPPRSKSRATSPSPSSTQQPHTHDLATHDSCPHDTFLCPSAAGSPLCTQCHAPVARLKAMHAAFLDMRDARDELSSRLAAREAQLARIEAEAAKSHLRANELEDQADEYLDRALQAEEKVKHLEAQVDELTGRVEHERQRANQLQSDKQAVENELEDLSQQLFEQANSMVSTEARKHDQVMRELRARCEAAELAARDQHDQCVELKRMVEVLERERERDELKVKELEKMHQFLAPPVPGTDAGASSRPGSWASNYSGQYSASNRSSFVHSSASPALAASPPPEVDLDAIDSYALEDFLDFMSAAPSVPLAKCTSLPFLQRALAADLNPCLAFTAPKAPSAQALVAAMLQGELEVDSASASKPPKSPRLRQGSNDSGISSGHEDPAARAPASPASSGSGGGFFSFMTRATPSATATVSPTSSPTPPAAPTKCTLCANHSSMPFTLQLTNDNKTYPMCAFCRDRVVAATDFVAFARNLRAGLFTRQSLGKVWADSLALRSRLGYARLGSLAAVDGEHAVGVGLAKAKSAVANGGV